MEMVTCSILAATARVAGSTLLAIVTFARLNAQPSRADRATGRIAFVNRPNFDRCPQSLADYRAEWMEGEYGFLDAYRILIRPAWKVVEAAMACRCPCSGRCNSK